MLKKMAFYSLFVLSIPNSVLLDNTIDETSGHSFNNTICKTINKDNNIEDIDVIEVKDSIKKELFVLLLKDLKLNNINVAKAIKLLNIKFPKIVYKQAMLESGWCKSILAINYNNLFGMKLPRNRKTYAVDKTESGYAIYSHWIYSILDYYEWQKTSNVNQYSCYLGYLKSRYYYEDEKYEDKLVSIKIDDVKFILE